ncbi:hypothetical protein NPIL_222561 [Nephila pilipes]|uniref:Uncharacterized protein n=1 Tax=Nephila pilipes TaxID=299642 RepID=A0A8X6P7T0_NEPPI|nr:hypothetical protein NPIL_222561 [Nephila pilipes]
MVVDSTTGFVRREFVMTSRTRLSSQLCSGHPPVPLLLMMRAVGREECQHNSSRLEANDSSISPCYFLVRFVKIELNESV